MRIRVYMEGGVDSNSFPTRSGRGFKFFFRKPVWQGGCQLSLLVVAETPRSENAHCVEERRGEFHSTAWSTVKTRFRRIPGPSSTNPDG